MVKAIVKEHPTMSYAVKKVWRWGMSKEDEEALVQEVMLDVSRCHDPATTLPPLLRRTSRSFRVGVSSGLFLLF